MGARIVVINPNSDTEVTRHLDLAVAPLRFAGGPAVECLTLAEGPPGIETAAHSAGVVGPLCRLIERHQDKADAFVIACFGDPGLHAARGTTPRPVVGIGEAGLTTALNLGERYGILTNMATDVAGHWRQARTLGIGPRLAGVRAVEIPVTGLADEARGLPRMIAAARALAEEDGADVIVPACAGMARYRERVAQAVGVPVVDATVAAVAVAIATVSARLASAPR